jgi:hypothetical protein
MVNQTGKLEQERKKSVDVRNYPSFLADNVVRLVDYIIQSEEFRHNQHTDSEQKDKINDGKEDGDFFHGALVQENILHEHIEKEYGRKRKEIIRYLRDPEHYVGVSSRHTTVDVGQPYHGQKKETGELHTKNSPFARPGHIFCNQCHKRYD